MYRWWNAYCQARNENSSSSLQLVCKWFVEKWLWMFVLEVRIRDLTFLVVTSVCQNLPWVKRTAWSHAEWAFRAVERSRMSTLGRGLAGTLPLWQKKLICNVYLFGCIGFQLQHPGSFLAAPGLSGCGTRASEQVGSVVVVLRLCCLEACGILVPHPWTKPKSPALQGGFLTTGPPGKSQESPFQNLWGYDRKQHNVVKHLSSKNFFKKEKKHQTGVKK